MFPFEQLDGLIALALAEDFGSAGDMTSQATLSDAQRIRGRITAKASGVIAGLPAIERVYAAIDPGVEVQMLTEDGAIVTPATVVAQISGSAQAVLAGERTALNFLQRLSGVATMTQCFVEAVEGTGTVILDTRKTTPGWRRLEKYAVRMGGGQNHRIGLYDMVLIKDNHIDAAGSITAAVTAVKQHEMARDLPLIVEVKNRAELYEALSLPINRILLDNMTPDEMQQAVIITEGRLPLEASGNVNLDTVRSIAETGVNFISIGALTHSAPILDFSMRLNME